MRLPFFLALLATALCPSEARAASLLRTQNNLCLDVQHGGQANGTRLQIWTCSKDNVNQQFTFVGNALKAANGKCVDLKDGNRNNHGALQLWDCGQNNSNQAWERAGQNIRLRGTNLCIDVTDGKYVDGGSVQSYTCDFRGISNQNFTDVAAANAVGPATAAGSSTASSWMGHPMISIEKFGQLHPECAPFKDAFVAAGKDQNIHPVFLASICMIESTCRERVGTNPWGPFQFSDEGAWNQFGGQGRDRQNIWDAAYAGARFYRWLMDGGRDIDAAMRYYNGAIERGGSPLYQRHVWDCSAGLSCW